MSHEHLTNLPLVDLAAALLEKVQAEAEEFNEVLAQQTTLNLATTVKSEEITSLNRIVSQLTNKLEAAERQVVAKESERIKAVGQTTRLETELKELKKLGDIKSVNRRLKEHKVKNTELSTAVTKLKKDRAELVKEKVNLASRLSSLEDFPLFSSSEGETIFLHGQKLRIKFHDAERLCVGLKYWNPLGIGRLVTFDGAKLNSSNAGIQEIEDVCPISNEMVDYCVGWFKENVITNKYEQELINPKHKKAG